MFVVNVLTTIERLLNIELVYGSMDREVLKEIGLHENEISVYLALLELDEALASELAQKTKLNRTLVYHLLDRLIGKGLASYFIKNNTKFFRASDPNKLLDFLKDRENKIVGIIPELLSIRRPKLEKPKVEVYEGKEGIKTILNMLVRDKPKEWLDLTAGTTHLVIPHFLDAWEKQRIKAGIKARMIVDSGSEAIKRAKELARLSKTEIRYFPRGGTSPSRIWIWNNKVAIALVTEDYPLCVLIENKEIAARFKGFFEWLWKLAATGQ
jgi:sugar-specific transcriptional regulator TrmB